jgi:hypothetical protein
MTLHFHYKGIPFTLTRRKPDRERDEKDLALLWYGMNLPKEGALARYVLRKYAGGGR